MKSILPTNRTLGEKSSPESLKPETDNVQIFQLVQKLLERPVAFHRIFAKIGGGVTAGLMLSQAWYWSNNKTAKARGGWFYKSQDDWEDETGLTRREQETARRKLKERGLLEEKLASVPATLHFRVNIERLFRTLFEAEREPAPEAPLVQSSLAETRKLSQRLLLRLQQRTPTHRQSSAPLALRLLLWVVQNFLSQTVGDMRIIFIRRGRESTTPAASPEQFTVPALRMN